MLLLLPLRPRWDGRAPARTRLWQPDELPRVHTIDVTMDPSDFRWQIDNQDMQYENARDMDVAANFDGVTLSAAKFKVHGGKFQRGGGQWGPGHAMEGGDCYRRDDPGAQFKCKPSFRLKFSKDAPLNSAVDTLFRYPADKQSCSSVRKFVLNGNWNDAAHIRSKLTQDLLKSAGGLAPRIEYARLLVNGEYFGLYSIEESLKDDWASCFGMDMNAELRGRDSCQAVDPAESGAQPFERACVAAGACATLPVAGAPEAHCEPPALTPAIRSRLRSEHDPSKCRENGDFDSDCCAGQGTSSCADGYTHVATGESCYQNIAFSYYCVPASSTTYPQCSSPEIPWIDRDHCSWDGRCDSTVVNTDGDAAACHTSADTCEGPCSQAPYIARWCPGRPTPPPPPPLAEGQCPPGCIYHEPSLRCDSAALQTDRIEVGKSTILKNDHGRGGSWPQSCGAETSCADGFERKEPSCDGCDNDFLMLNNPEDTPDCSCDAVPQLDQLFATMHSGDKQAIQAAMNMTSVFVYQAFAVLVNNGDTGSHNYYMSKVVGQPWRVINVDPDWSFGRGFQCRGDPDNEANCRPPALTPAIRSRLRSEHDPSKCRENGDFDSDCCAGQGTSSCADGYTHVPTGESCYQNIAFSYYCVPASSTTYPQCEIPWVDRDHCSWDGRCDSTVVNTDGDAAACHTSADTCEGPCSQAPYIARWCPGRAPPEAGSTQCPPGCTHHAATGDPDDAATVKRLGGSYCPYVATHEALYASNQGNQFLRQGGPLQTYFEEEYLRWFQAMLRLPTLQACAVTDAAEVLMHPDSGILRAAYDEDRAFWHRRGDADEELAFIQAWTRLRFASVAQEVDTLVAQYDAQGTRTSASYPSIGGRDKLVSCGTATDGQVRALCGQAGISEGGVCDQGSVYPRCVPARDAGWDACNCPPGWGWSTATAQCRAGGSTSDSEADACESGSGLGPGSLSGASCDNLNDFGRLVAPVNLACCAGANECSSGAPSQCDAQCAMVLLPLMRACAAFLEQPKNSALQGILQGAVALCPHASGGSSGH